MSKDIGPIVEGWQFEPGKITVRKVRGLDGSVKIQMRLDLGLLQMQTLGRPDGRRPFGAESILGHLEQACELYRQGQGTDEGFAASPEECEWLRAESTMFYYRYLANFVLEDFPAVIRDTERNLRCLDFLAHHAQQEQDRTSMEQYRPYILMMNARARAQLALLQHRPRLAQDIIAETLDELRDFYAQFEQENLYEASAEATALESLRREIHAKIPVSPVDQLKRQLSKAVNEERYEDAAKLRDLISHAATSK